MGPFFENITNLDNESAFYGGFKFSMEYCEHTIQY